MLHYLQRVSRASLSLHFLLPLGISLGVATASGYLGGKVTGTQDLVTFWFERLPELFTIYITFVAVLLYRIFRDTSIRIANLGILDGVLSDSTGYFAFAAIPLREWFDASVQVYLARLVARQVHVPGYSHERVLLFFSRGDLDAVHASYLDEYYARCLIRIHELYEIKLAFLPHAELFETLERLTVAERKALGCYPRLMALLPDGVLQHVRLSWTSRPIRALAFAVVSFAAMPSSIVLFSKGPRSLAIRQVRQEAAMAPYLKLVEQVKARILRPDGTLSPEYDFAKHMTI